MILSKEKCKSILNRILSQIRFVDESFIRLTGTDQTFLRYANNMISSASSPHELKLTITVSVQSREGKSSVTQLDDSSIKKCIKRAVEIAKRAPKNPEYMPPLCPQKYKKVNAFFKETSTCSTENHVSAIKKIIDYAASKQMKAFGTLSTATSFIALASSNGLFAYHIYTEADCSTTAHTLDGTGSAKNSGSSKSNNSLNPVKVGEKAVKRANTVKNPQPLKPGKYTVVLAPEALATLVESTVYFVLNARRAHQGMTFTSKDGGKTKLGDQCFGKNITIHSDPFHPDLMDTPFGSSGIPKNPTKWIEKGIIKNLYYSRYWAKKKGVSSSSSYLNILMAGGPHSMDDLIKSVDYGIYIPRFFYTNVVDPIKLHFTGLTRDGIMLIQKGKLTTPLVNFRFNQNTATLLNSLTKLSTPRLVTDVWFPALFPAAIAQNFNFTSQAPSI